MDHLIAKQMLKYYHMLKALSVNNIYEGSDYIRVATAQGKQGIWLLIFPDRENTGNLVNLIFYTGKIVATQGKF